MGDGQSALDYARDFAYDLLLDVMLPKLDGFTVVRQLRTEGIAVPVLMLTARSAVPDRVAGLNAGADDYLTKPFDPEELLARVNAMTRRTGAVVMDQLTFHDVTLALNTAQLSCGASSVQLSPQGISGGAPAAGRAVHDLHQRCHHQPRVGAGLRGHGQQCGGVYLLPAEEAAVSEFQSGHPESAEDRLPAGGGSMKAYRRRFVLFNMLLIGVVLTVMAAGIAVLPSTAARRRGRYFSLSSRERNPRSRRHNSLLLLKSG